MSRHSSRSVRMTGHEAAATQVAECLERVKVERARVYEGRIGLGVVVGGGKKDTHGHQCRRNRSLDGKLNTAEIKIGGTSFRRNTTAQEPNTGKTWREFETANLFSSALVYGVPT